MCGIETDCAVNRSCGTFRNTIQPDCSKVPKVYQLLASTDKQKISTPKAAYVGISVGAAVLLVLLGVLFWFWRRRKREFSELKEMKREEATCPDIELDSRSLAEVNGFSAPQELDEGIKWPPPQELDESTDVKRIWPAEKLDVKQDHGKNDGTRNVKIQEPQELDGTPSQKFINNKI
jgi:hypothetical protein